MIAVDMAQEARQWRRATWVPSEKVNSDFWKFRYKTVECRHIGKLTWFLPGEGKTGILGNT